MRGDADGSTGHREGGRGDGVVLGSLHLGYHRSFPDRRITVEVNCFLKVLASYL